MTRGWIGIQYNSEPDAALFRALGLKDTRGVIVDNVTPDGPAEKAGLMAGDIITEINTRGVSNGSELVDIVSNTTIGRSVTAKVFRDGSEHTLNVQIEDRAKGVREAVQKKPPSTGESGSPPSLGLRVQDITPQVARQLGLDRSDGAVIAGVDASGVAADAGLERGIVIKRVIEDGRGIDINNADDFRRAESRLVSGMSVALMLLVRDATGDYRAHFVALTIP